ncbi:hypothetical protein SAMN04487895_10322 [Paenibacillus sophorae]|uniref:Uncharacterized protein n=1 Tax=Paenibacillus sophorae TaxID=1333845 RepID=A0A1H8JHG0_9BACL|nr:hypothetical protein SAMN04487895_10322 [Paenibacillus sophorae]
MPTSIVRFWTFAKFESGDTATQPINPFERIAGPEYGLPQPVPTIAAQELFYGYGYRCPHKKLVSGKKDVLILNEIIKILFYINFAFLDIINP